MDTRGYIVIIIIVLFIGFFIGYNIGVISTVKLVSDIANRFVDIDEDLIKQAVNQYKGHIKGCYPEKNEILYNSFAQSLF